MLLLESEGGKKLVSQFEGRQGEFTLTWGRVSLFVLFRPSMSWVRPIHVGGDDLLYSVYQFNY